MPKARGQKGAVEEVRNFNYLSLCVRETGPGTERVVRTDTTARLSRKAAGGKIALKMSGLTDDQVLDLRGMHQFQGMSATDLAREFDKPVRSIYALLAYRTRGLLEPKAEDYPRGSVGRVKK